MGEVQDEEELEDDDGDDRCEAASEEWEVDEEEVGEEEGEEEEVDAEGKTEASEGKAEEREGVGEVVERGSGIGRGVGPVVRGDGAAEFDCVEEGYGEKAAEAEVDCSGCELLDGDESDAGAEE